MSKNSLVKWHDVEQGTEEWLNLRLGKATSSNFDTICANLGKAFGSPANEYAQKKALEIVTGMYDDTGFKSSYMERGTELEPEAIDLYQIETFNDVSNGGFSELCRYGDSPDGMIGLNGCIEVKSVIPKTQWKNLLRGTYDPSYKWQIQGHLLISDKEWCDWVSYCPEFPKNKQLIIHRVYKDDVMQEQLKERLNEFDDKVDHYISLLK